MSITKSEGQSTEICREEPLIIIRNTKKTQVEYYFGTILRRFINIQCVVIEAVGTYEVVQIFVVY